MSRGFPNTVSKSSSTNRSQPGKDFCSGKELQTSSVMNTWYFGFSIIGFRISADSFIQLHTNWPLIDEQISNHHPSMASAAPVSPLLQANGSIKGLTLSDALSPAQMRDLSKTFTTTTTTDTSTSVTPASSSGSEVKANDKLASSIPHVIRTVFDQQWVTMKDALTAANTLVAKNDDMSMEYKEVGNNFIMYRTFTTAIYHYSQVTRPPIPPSHHSLRSFGLELLWCVS